MLCFEIGIYKLDLHWRFGICGQKWETLARGRSFWPSICYVIWPIYRLAALMLLVFPLEFFWTEEIILSFICC